MPFCANCGAQVEGRFCAKCGSAVGDPIPPGAGYQPPQSAAPPSGAAYPPPAPPVAAGLSEKAASALSYVLGIITGVLFLVLEPYNKSRTVRFHAFQSIFLNVAWFVVWIAFSMFTGITGRIMGFWLIGLLWPVLGLAWLVLWIYMIVSAYQGKTVSLPIIGPLARKQA